MKNFLVALFLSSLCFTAFGSEIRLITSDHNGWSGGQTTSLEELQQGVIMRENNGKCTYSFDMSTGIAKIVLQINQLVTTVQGSIASDLLTVEFNDYSCTINVKK